MIAKIRFQIQYLKNAPFKVKQNESYSSIFSRHNLCPKVAFFFSNTFARFGQLEICEKDCFILPRVYYLTNSLIKFVTGGKKNCCKLFIEKHDFAEMFVVTLHVG